MARLIAIWSSVLALSAFVIGGVWVLLKERPSERSDLEALLKAEPQALQALVREQRSVTPPPAPSSERGERLGAAFASDDVSQALKAAILTNDVALIERAQGLLRADGQVGLRAVTHALERIPRDDFAAERAVLWSLAGELGRSEPALAGQALAELVERPAPGRPSQSSAQTDQDLNRSLSGVPTDLVPMAAHEAYLSAMDGQPEAAMQGTLDAIQAQAVEAVRNILAQQFARHYPALTQGLMAALASRGISVRPPETL
jgi:hypothetical protein